MNFEMVALLLNMTALTFCAPGSMKKPNGTSFHAILSALRARTEEAAGRAEPVLSTAVSRPRWLASHLAIATVGSSVVLLLGSLGLGITASATADEPSLLPKLLGAGLAHLPALWLIVGLAAALFGLAPRATGLAWVVVGYALFVGMFGGLVGLPDWTIEVSPFGVVPQVPAEDLTFVPLVALTAVAVGLTAVGLAGFRRRDLRSTT